LRPEILAVEMADSAREDHVELPGLIGEWPLCVTDQEVDARIAPARHLGPSLADVDAAHPEALLGEKRCPEAVPAGNVEQAIAPVQPEAADVVPPHPARPHPALALVAEALVAVETVVVRVLMPIRRIHRALLVS